MRKMTTIAVLASLALAPAGLTPAFAQAEQPPAAAQAQNPAAAIKEVRIIDVSELPAETQTQVNNAVAQRSDADLQQMQSALDATPVVASKMQSEGVTSDQIILASLDPSGTLTLVTRKAG
ncbi:hypothetical protein [Propylenella binzhouense]|uniref:Uncharacterized protein n=1 Tax=Propylenella binzhouense TaxID=2555902 RepID=A0A964T762_9HYPH|nr:hypothetical protein [Propylenella binzhouense]MYZ49796.1 hypothetical protein [Propylenella binzhouense]